MSKIVEFVLGKFGSASQHTLGRLGAGEAQQPRAGDLADWDLEINCEIDDVLQDFGVLLLLGHIDLAHAPGAGEQ